MPRTAKMDEKEIIDRIRQYRESEGKLPTVKIVKSWGVSDLRAQEGLRKFRLVDMGIDWIVPKPEPKPEPKPKSSEVPLRSSDLLLPEDIGLTEEEVDQACREVVRDPRSSVQVVMLRIRWEKVSPWIKERLWKMGAVEVV